MGVFTLLWPNIMIIIYIGYLQSFKGLPIPDEEFLAVSIDAKIDYHQTVDLGKARNTSCNVTLTLHSILFSV